MATPRYQKQITFNEDEWKAVHDAAEYAEVSALSFIREAALTKAENVLKKKKLLEGE